MLWLLTPSPCLYQKRSPLLHLVGAIASHFLQFLKFNPTKLLGAVIEQSRMEFSFSSSKQSWFCVVIC